MIVFILTLHHHLDLVKEKMSVIIKNLPGTQIRWHETG